MSEEVAFRIVGAPYPGPRLVPAPVQRSATRGLLLHLASGAAWRVCHVAVVWLAAEAILAAKGGVS